MTAPYRECIDCGVPTGGLYCAKCLTRPAKRLAAPTQPPEEDLTEAQIQARIIDALKADDWRVWRVGQRNAHGTQDPGVADLIAMHERHGIWFLEVKRPTDGAQSMAQRDFEEAVLLASGHYEIVWSVERLQAVLPAHGGTQS
jgi:hypothetical protein